LENRARLLFEIINGIRIACGVNFLIGVRLSPERFGMQLSEMKILCQQLIDSGKFRFGIVLNTQKKKHIGKKHC